MTNPPPFGNGRAGADDDLWAPDDPADLDDTWDDYGPDDDLPPLPDAPLRTPSEALAAMLALVGPERDGPPALWCLLLDAERRPVPLVLPLEGLPPRPLPQECDRVAYALRRVLDEEVPDGGVVLAYVRAEGGDAGRYERDWDTAMRRAADHRRLPVVASVAIGAHRARVLR
jgi:hypothetical protein